MLHQPEPKIEDTDMNTKRGLNYQEAMTYTGVKRKTFDEVWRPKLVGMRQGVCLLFDREDLDALFQQFKQEAFAKTDAANTPESQAHNGERNGRPIQTKGAQVWAKGQGVSTPLKMDSGRLTNGNPTGDFASAAFRVMTKRNAG